MSQSKLSVGWSGPLGSHSFLRVVCRLLSWSLSWLRSRPKCPWREFLFADFSVRVWKGFLMVCLRATPPSPSYELPPMPSPLPSPLCKSHQAGHSGWWLARKALYSWCFLMLWCSFPYVFLRYISSGFNSDPDGSLVFIQKLLWSSKFSF